MYYVVALISLGKLCFCFVLGHPSVRLFFTHGGQLSIIEAIKFGMPVVGMPLYADQISNIKMAQEDGIGVYLDYDSLTYESVFKALQTVLSNSRYCLLF